MAEGEVTQGQPAASATQVFCPTCGTGQPRCWRCTNWLPLPQATPSDRSHWAIPWFCDVCLDEVRMRPDDPGGEVKYREEIAKVMGADYRRINRVSE